MYKMVASVSTKGVLKPSQNRVRTSVALEGNAMWEKIGVVNEMAGTNAHVESLINAPQRGAGRQAKAAGRKAAAEAMRATGGFNTSITDYESLLSLAKSQGAVGGDSARGACKICGQLGHLTKQCRNHLSKYYQRDAAQNKSDHTAAGPPTLTGNTTSTAALNHNTNGDNNHDDELSSGLSSDSESDSSSSSSSDRERERRKSRKRSKEKKRRREKQHSRKSHKSSKRRKRHN